MSCIRWLDLQTLQQDAKQVFFFGPVPEHPMIVKIPENLPVLLLKMSLCVLELENVGDNKIGL